MSIKTPAGHEIGYDNTEGPLYHRPQGQSSWFAALEINVGGTVYATAVGGAWDGVPARVWHGLCVRIPLSERLTLNQLRTVLNYPRVQALIDKIISCMDVKWDGKNHVGNHAPGFEGLVAELTDCVNIEGKLELWDDVAAGVRFRDLEITAETSDEELLKIEQALREDALANGAVWDCNLKKKLLELREELK